MPTHAVSFAGILVRSMIDAITPVSGGAVPAEIFDSVIGRDSVVVAAFRPAWRWPTKCNQDESMHLRGDAPVVTR